MRNTAVIIGAGPGGAAAAVRLAQRGVKNVVLRRQGPLPAREDLRLGAVAQRPQDRRRARHRRRRQAARLSHPLAAGRHAGQARDAPDDRRRRGGRAPAQALRQPARRARAQRSASTSAAASAPASWCATGAAASSACAARTSEILADYVIVADGAHSIFSTDPRPKRTISTLMGWWEGMQFAPGTMEMIFDRNLSPLYGWMFPENDARVNIGICMDGEGSRRTQDRAQRARGVRAVPRRPLSRAARRHAADRQVQGPPDLVHDLDPRQHRRRHPASSARRRASRTTPPARGSSTPCSRGMFAADALADVVGGRATRRQAWSALHVAVPAALHVRLRHGPRRCAARSRRRCSTPSPGLQLAVVRRAATWALGSALAGSTLTESAAPVSAPTQQETSSPRAVAN